MQKSQEIERQQVLEDQTQPEAYFLWQPLHQLYQLNHPHWFQFPAYLDLQFVRLLRLLLAAHPY